MYLYKNSLNDGKTSETEAKLILVGASACSLKIDFEAVAEDVGALLRLLWPTMGLLAAGVYPNPSPQRISSTARLKGAPD